jgi:hypothetical protein
MNRDAGNAVSLFRWGCRRVAEEGGRSCEQRRFVDETFGGEVVEIIPIEFIRIRLRIRDFVVVLAFDATDR